MPFQVDERKALVLSRHVDELRNGVCVCVVDSAGSSLKCSFEDCPSSRQLLDIYYVSILADILPFKNPVLANLIFKVIYLGRGYRNAIASSDSRFAVSKSPLKSVLNDCDIRVVYCRNQL